MLEHLHIQNYRLFKELDLEPLRRVNLITGKNNTGKTAVLETLRILFAAPPDLEVINNILFKRGDWNDKYLNESIPTLFNSPLWENNAAINGYFSLDNNLDFDFRISFDFSNKEGFNKTSFNSSLGGTEHKIKIVLDEKFRESDRAYSNYVPAVFDFFNVGWWESTDLTPKKKKLIELLKTVVSDIEDIGLDLKTFQPKVLTSNAKTPRPLKNWGDGTNRFFNIILGLLCNQGGMLLVDEIDLGLHHSVQRKLWEIIFKFSKELNVQVFATTHSQDCVEAFMDVLNEKGNENEGQYIRLQRSRLDESVIEPIYYDAQKLKNSINFNLETR
jgi:predicted ATP-dependent endonuclease of OLD family